MKLIISLNLFIFSLLSSYAESSAETKSRKLGIGIRGGLYYDKTSFGDETKYIDRGTSQNEPELFYEPDPLINPNISRRFPILFQFDENLIKNWAYTKIILNFDIMEVEDVPPYLNNTSYSDLIDSCPSSNHYGQCIVNSSNTFTDEFKSSYPKYSDQIESKSNPSLSADFSVSAIFLGKLWGIFYPINDRHRIFQIGLGIGLGSYSGKYSINVCDPYVFDIIPTELNSFTYHDGNCEKKSELFSENISFVAPSTAFDFILYSYVGDSFEFNIAPQMTIDSTLLFGRTLFVIAPDGISDFRPNFQFVTYDLISFVYYL